VLAIFEVADLYAHLDDSQVSVGRGRILPLILRLQPIQRFEGRQRRQGALSIARDQAEWVSFEP